MALGALPVLPAAILKAGLVSHGNPAILPA